MVGLAGAVHFARCDAGQPNMRAFRDQIGPSPSHTATGVQAKDWPEGIIAAAARSEKAIIRKAIVDRPRVPKPKKAALEGRSGGTLGPIGPILRIAWRYGDTNETIALRVRLRSCANRGLTVSDPFRAFKGPLSTA